MTLSQELIWRGFVKQSTFTDITDLDKQDWVFYHGFDASADSQTIGNLAAMMVDKVFLRHGHKAIILAGGATSLIGDPGGKDKERELQNEERIAKNVARAQEEIKIVFGGHDFTMVNNLDWTKSMTALEFLRDVGKHFAMSNLVNRDYIAQRLQTTGISYTEFSYTLLQGNDYLHLNNEYGCNLQIGGSDQWGNCLSGVDLVRKANGKQVHALTLPLVINQATGKKFGKSEDGAVWLSPTKTSPYKFYQFWLNADDDGVEMYLKVYTELDKDTIDKLAADHTEDPSQRIAQKRLAEELTRLIHGQDNLEAVQQVTKVVFGDNDVVMSDQIMSVLRQELPTIDQGSFDPIKALVDLQFASSNSEARKLLDAGAVKLGLEQSKIVDWQEQNRLEQQVKDNSFDNYILVRKGKNNLGLIKITG